MYKIFNKDFTFETIKTVLKGFIGNELFSDFGLQAGDEEETIRCHRLVLKLLLPDDVELVQQTLNVKWSSQRDILRLVELAYSGSTTATSKEDLDSLLDLSRKLRFAQKLKVEESCESDIRLPVIKQEDEPLSEVKENAPTWEGKKEEEDSEKEDVLATIFDTLGGGDEEDGDASDFDIESCIDSKTQTEDEILWLRGLANKQYPCLVCKEFKSKTLLDLDKHIQSNHPKMTLKQMIPNRYPFKCKYCDKAYASVKLIQIHVKEAHELKEATIHCRDKNCSEMFKTKFREEQHYKRKHHVKPAVVTKRRFNRTFQKYESHFKCPLCDTSLHNNPSLRRHIRVSHPDTPFDQVKDKIETHPFVCKVCGKKFSKVSTYVDHEKRHNLTEKTIPCQDENCSKKFFTDHQAKDHFYKRHGTYAKNRTYKVVRPDGTITQHLLKIKPESCVIDSEGNKMIKSSGLQNPAMKRAAEKISNLGPEFEKSFDENWNCLRCGKANKGLARARSHHLVHFPSRPFVCDVCGDAFKQNSHLQTHKQYKHDNLKIACPLCPKIFPIRIEFTRHMKKVHHKIHKVKCSGCQFEDLQHKARFHNCKSGENKFIDFFIDEQKTDLT